MFTGIDFEKAIDYYRKGKEVIVLDRNSCKANGNYGLGYDVFPFEELFSNLDFLVDVPAVQNPEFEVSVQRMKGVAPNPDQIIQAVHETQEESLENDNIPLSPTRDAVETEVPVETKESVVLRMKNQGMTIDEIVEETGFKKGTVKQYYTRKQGKSLPKTVDNADRHLCKTCRFRGKNHIKNGCDYIVHNKKSRGCTVENCSVYEKGDPDPIQVED